MVSTNVILYLRFFVIYDIINTNTKAKRWQNMGRLNTLTKEYLKRPDIGA